MPERKILAFYSPYPGAGKTTAQKCILFSNGVRRCFFCGTAPSTRHFQGRRQRCSDYTPKRCNAKRYPPRKIFPAFSIILCPANHTANSDAKDRLFPNFPNNCTPFHYRFFCVPPLNNRKSILPKTYFRYFFG